MIKNILIAVLVLICAGCYADVIQDVKLRSQVTAGNPIYTIVNSIVTNEVDAATYNKQTNGYSVVEYKMFESGNYITYNTITCWNVLNGATINPDPFAEKITTTYFIVIAKDVYYLRIADLDKREYAVKSTVIKRWKVVNTQKIKMNETSEKIIE